MRVLWAPGEGVGTSETVIVADLTANAVTHGCVPGRDFELRLALGPMTSALRSRTPGAKTNH